jgi:fibro-slime domain-containing protein
VSHWLLAVPLGLLLAQACSAGGGDASSGSGSGGNTGSGASGTGAAGSDGSGASVTIDAGDGDTGNGSGGEASDVGGCGDGILQRSKGEACDDGNSAPADGCSADCTLVETGFACLTPGEPCVSTVVCGDALISGAETCDDDNVASNDGCDAFCQVETGWVCPAVGSRCTAAACGDGILAGLEQCEDNDTTPTGGDGCSATCEIEPGWVCETAGEGCREAVCGDGVVEGGEPCDQLNDTVVGDGCSPLCEAEPTCTKPTDADGCSSNCGDGLILPTDVDEDCDDGNRKNGDGCDSNCKVEDGYDCAISTDPLPNTVTIPFVFRDFVALPAAPGACDSDDDCASGDCNVDTCVAVPRHPDFQSRCIGQQADGMVMTSLDSFGKPINSGTCNLDADCTVDSGQVDLNLDHCTAHESCAASGGFDSCDQLHANHKLTLASPNNNKDPFYFWYRDVDVVSKTKIVPTNLTLQNGKYSYDANGLYPLDDAGWVAAGGEVERNNHNYGFTSEVRRWFEFNGGELLTFDGDDDVWVFINGQLALDIGGIHNTEVRTIRLNANGTVDCKEEEPGAQTFDELANCATAQRTLTISTGNVYEIALFHAERHTDASNFRLALTGFVTQKSECTPVCGDGTQTIEEDCDNGDENDNDAYGGCTTNCKRGPYCGDKVLQVDDEECDDGVNLTSYSLDGSAGCAPGCKLSPFCGDANIDSLFGEQCDDGVNAGGYGGCATDCTLGPRCGDGEKQIGEEQCDDGNLVSGDGCSSICESDIPR